MLAKGDLGTFWAYFRALFDYLIPKEGAFARSVAAKFQYSLGNVIMVPALQLLRVVQKFKCFVDRPSVIAPELIGDETRIAILLTQIGPE